MTGLLAAAAGLLYYKPHGLHAPPTVMHASRAQSIRRHGCVQCVDQPPLVDFDTLNVVWQRGLDTVEDLFLLGRRLPAEPVNTVDCLAAWDDPDDPRPRVLIIGSGWGAQALVKIVEADLYRLLVVSPRNYFIFTPMLAAVRHLQTCTPPFAL